MNEPGRFVKLHKVQDSSKNVRKKKNTNKKQNPGKKQQQSPNKKQQKQQNQAKPEAVISKKNHNNPPNSKSKLAAKSKLKKIAEKVVAGKPKNLGAGKQKNAVAGKQKNVVAGKPKNVEQPEAKANKKVTGAVNEKKLGFSEDLADRLKSSRFRFMNEELYTITGDQAIEVFNQDDGAFQTYHDGYRKQVEQWPLNPLDRIINSVKKLPPSFIVADFGCGEARLSKEVSQKCYNFDLVAANESVIAGNMAHTPLSSGSVNVAVFCLSLMGTNIKDFLLEANRVLKVGGHLKIAEIESRFDNVNEFIRNLKSLGFDLITKDVATKVFYFLYFRKVKDVSESRSLPKFSLKPCLYKKR